MNAIYNFVLTPTEVERVESIKFLRVTITDDLSRTSHVNATFEKAQQRRLFLRLLRKFGMSIRSLTNFYGCTIESVLSRYMATALPKAIRNHKKVLCTVQTITDANLPSMDCITRLIKASSKTCCTLKINDQTALQLGDLSEETEEPPDCNIRLFAEEEGYEADSESNSEDFAAKEEGYMQKSLFHCYTGTIPHLFLRYIDDCISTVACSLEELEQFINFTNAFHPNLKFTWTIFLPFLDLSVPIS
eukprot:g32760.t1